MGTGPKREVHVNADAKEGLSGILCKWRDLMVRSFELGIEEDHVHGYKTGQMDHEIETISTIEAQNRYGDGNHGARIWRLSSLIGRTEHLTSPDLVNRALDSVRDNPMQGAEKGQTTLTNISNKEGWYENNYTRSFCEAGKRLHSGKVLGVTECGK